MGAKSGRLGLLLGAGALVVAAGAWLLMHEPSATDAPRDASVLTRAHAARDAAAPELPATGAHGATPETLDAAAPALSPEALAAAAAAAQAALPGVEALFTGRIVDERGAPVAGAVITHVPAYKLRKELGLVTNVMSGTLAWDKLLQTRSAADGTFSLATRDLPAVAGTVTRTDSRTTYTPSSQPELVVQHPDFAVLVCLCRSFREGPCDVGTLTLMPGAALIGRVVDGDGVPVPGARLRLDEDNEPPDWNDSADWALTRQALVGATGPDGRFTITGFLKGSHELQVLHEDFVPAYFNTSMRLGETTDAGDVTLARGDGIRGIVLDSGGRPVAGADILVRASGHGVGSGVDDSVLMELKMSVRSRGIHEVRTRTGAGGEFNAGTLNQKHYSVFADAAGLEPGCVRDVAVGSSDVVLRLLPQATLLVTVVDATSGAPVVGVSGKAMRCSGNERAAQSGFDVKLDVLAGSAAGASGDGTGVLLVLRAGPVRTELTVSAPGYETRGYVLPGVQPGEQLARTVKLKREALLAGHVFAERANADGTRAPIANAVVTLGPPEESRVKLSEHTTRTDADGAFRFGELHNGDWSLTVSAPGFLDSEPRPLGVKSEQVRDDIEVLLKPGAQLAVLLFGADGLPATGKEVVVKYEDQSLGRSPWKALTDTEGRARFDALPEAAMQISAYPGGEAHATLSSERPTEVTLALRMRPVVRGRVTSAGEPVAGASVVAYEWISFGPSSKGGFSDEVEATASALGEFELQLAGPVSLVLVARDPAEAAGSCTRPVPVTLDWGQQLRADLAFGGARLRGEVVNAATKQPIAGAWVTLRPLAYDGDAELKKYSGSFQSGGRSGDDGHFLIQRAQGGASRLTATAKGYDMLVLDSVVAVEGDTVELPRLELSQGCAFKGVLRTASGKPLPPGLRVSLRKTPDSGEWSSSSVAEDGSWIIGGSTLMPGTWTVCVVKKESSFFASDSEGAPLSSVDVTLLAGEEKVVDLVIDA